MIFGGFLLAGCSVEERADSGSTADINAAAQAAQGDIDTYAANSLDAAPVGPEAVTRRAPVALASRIAPADSAAPGNDSAPEIAASGEALAVAAYRCPGDLLVSVRFDEAAGTATIRADGRDLAALADQSPASGMWYKGDGYELRGSGRTAAYTAPGSEPVACSTE